MNVIFVFSFTELFCLLCFLTSCCCYCYIEGRSGIRKVEKELTICRVLEKSPSDMLYVRTCCNIKRKKEKARAGMKCCCTFYDCDSISTWRIVSVPFYLILSVGFSACATVRESALLHGWVTQHSRESRGLQEKGRGLTFEPVAYSSRVDSSLFQLRLTELEGKTGTFSFCLVF